MFPQGFEAGSSVEGAGVAHQQDECELDACFLPAVEGDTPKSDRASQGPLLPCQPGAVPCCLSAPSSGRAGAVPMPGELAGFQGGSCLLAKVRAQRRAVTAWQVAVWRVGQGFVSAES